VHLKALKVFCDVVSRRSFSAGASANGVSQSAASQMVSHVEERLGAKLIDRSKRPFVLTPAGEVFYGPCRKLVTRFYTLYEEVRKLDDMGVGHVRVASIYSVGLSHMNYCVKEFLSRYPKSNMRVEYQHPDRVYQLVERGQASLGLVSYPKPSRKIKVIPWREEALVVACSPRHPFALRRGVVLSELHGLDMVGYDDSLHIRREVDRALGAAGVEVNVVMQFDNTETMKRAIEIDAGIGLLPEPTLAREIEVGALVGVPVSDADLVRPLGIVHRRGKEPTAAAKRFIQVLLEQATTSAADKITASSTSTDFRSLVGTRA
jgi:DNA-binding transcriptional LysR family regulator